MRVKLIERDKEKLRVWFEHNGVEWYKEFFDYFLHDTVGFKSWLNSIIEDVNVRSPRRNTNLWPSKYDEGV